MHDDWQMESALQSCLRGRHSVGLRARKASLCGRRGGAKVDAEAVAVLEEKLADMSMPKPSLYLHPVCSKQSSPPDAAHAWL